MDKYTQGGNVRNIIILLLLAIAIPCDEGYTEIDGECYYQSDLDVVQNFIDSNVSLYDYSPIALTNPNNWGEVETMTIGYGHGFAITPLHLVKAYGSIANNGYEVYPTIIKKSKKNIKNNIIVKENTSEYFLDLLRSVVTETKFTGPRVKIEGYNLGGKTGTAMLTKKKGGYHKDRDLTSFISVFPVKNPRYVVLSIIEYPKKIKGSYQKTTGAVVNAPLVKEIIQEMIKILNIPLIKTNNILKADINSFYNKKYVSL